MLKNEVVATLEKIIENSRVAITIVDHLGRFTLFNRAAEKLTGFSASEVIGEPLAMLYPDDGDLEKIQEELSRDGKVDGYETLISGKDGRLIPISILVIQLTDKDGRPTGSFGISLDLTEKRNLEAEVEDARRQLELLIKLMSHDIRNFSQTTMGYLDILLMDGVDRDQQIRLLKICLRQHRRIDNLIDRALTLMNLAQHQEEGVSSVELDPVLDQVVRAVEDAYADRQPQIHRGRPIECKVRATSLLFELIYNVVSNAIEHNPRDHPEVWIRVSVSHESENDSAAWRLSIEDNGPGILDSHKPTMFDRLDRSSPRGSGIGLSLVKALAAHIGARIQVSDRIPGSSDQGVCFEFLLPEG